MEPAIRFDHVSKRYRIGVGRRSLRDVTANVGRRLRRKPSGPAAEEYMWALRDLSFEVNPGEALGIIGPNGSGKTTTLKLLSHITYPTEGQIDIKGRVASLIELGAGFHQELSGRENVYLNGAILGLKKHEIDAKLDEIVAFAGLEKFIDTPVKRYSSGMYARLGFSVAAHIDPDVLLVDEVLAVGDMNFQNKCYERMRQLRSGQRAIVFISHNLFAVRSLCTKAVFLAHGNVIAAGPTDEVLQAYKSYAAQSQAREKRSDDSEAGTIDVSEETPIRIGIVQFLNTDRQPSEVFEFGEPMIIRIGYTASQPIENPTFSLVFIRGDGTVCEGTSTIICENPTGQLHGDGYVEFELPGVMLTPNVYTMEVAISNQHVFTYDYYHGVETFRVETAKPIHFPKFVAILPGEWRIARGTAEPQILGQA
jgi:lipopolysaccharide transport system ATP-binding protein